MESILVTGATGHLGAVVVETLLSKVPTGKITVLVRDESKAASFKAKGVNVKQGNYRDIPSLESAMKGIDKVLLISSNDFNDRLGQHKNVIDAAKKAGVKHILYTGVSMKDINTSPLKPILQDHFQTEDYIKANGFTYTFLRDGLYAEVIPLFLGEKVVETGIYFPAGEGKVPFAVREDLAVAIANVLSSEGHENKIYPLTGSVAYSFAQIASILSELSGKTVQYTSPDPEAFKAMLKQIGLPEEIVMVSAFFAAGIQNNDFENADATLEKLLGRKPKELKSFLKGAFGL